MRFDYVGFLIKPGHITRNKKPQHKLGFFCSDKLSYSGFTENLPKAIMTMINATGKPTTKIVPIVASIISPIDVIFSTYININLLTSGKFK